MNFILLGTATTPTGRGLLQEDETIFVLTSCCTAKYTNQSEGICSRCGVKDTDARHWRTTVSLTEDWVKEERHWKEWGQCLFGYKDFVLQVKG